VRRIAGLDELRGIAILAVLLVHWLGARQPVLAAQSPRWAVVAAAAVDLFFIISGFLITVILVRAKGQPGYFAAFYTRRAARILPLALLVIAVSHALDPATRHLWPAYLFFYNNYQIVALHGQAMTGISVMWSLAVEEQFYVVWPLLIWLFPRRWLWLLVALACGALIWLPLSATPGTISIVDGVYLTDGRTHLRALPIALGAALALWWAGVLPRPAWFASGLVAGLIATMVLWQRMNGLLTYPLLLGLAALVWLILAGRLLPNVALLRWFGLRCYGLYLLHAFVLIAMGGRVAGLPAPFDLALFVAVCAVLAELSFRLLEGPIIALAHRRADAPSPSPAPSAMDPLPGTTASRG
jgi:peptidoglycan/LPS O-acetylase OafA/YrhL